MLCWRLRRFGFDLRVLQRDWAMGWGLRASGLRRPWRRGMWERLARPLGRALLVHEGSASESPFAQPLSPGAQRGRLSSMQRLVYPVTGRAVAACRLEEDHA